MTVPIVEDKYRGTTKYMQVYAELIRAAQYRGVTTYQAIAQIMGLPLTGSYMGSETGRILGEISEDELAQGRPMLSAVAVSASGVPGKGFFGLVEGLGKLPAGATAEEKLLFGEKEKEALYETWQRTFKS